MFVAVAYRSLNVEYTRGEIWNYQDKLMEDMEQVEIVLAKRFEHSYVHLVSGVAKGLLDELEAEIAV